MKKISKYVLVFIVMIISGCVLLTLSSIIPRESLKDKAKESAEILNEQKNSFRVHISYKNMDIKFDNYTDALMINTAYSLAPNTPFYSAMMARKNYIDNITEIIHTDTSGELVSPDKYTYYDSVAELNDVVKDNVTESYEYARYWHGYLIFLRPLLLIFNITQIRTLLLIIFVILALIFLYKIYKNFDLGTAIIFLFGLIICDYFYIGLSLQGTPVFLIAIIASIILLSKELKDKLLFFFIVGGLASFFDFLTVPIVTLGIPLLIYVLIQTKKEYNFKSIFFDIIKICIVWSIGYIGVWATKWILVDVLYHKELIKTVIEQFLYRTKNIQKQDPDVTIFDFVNIIIYYTKNTLLISTVATIILSIIKIIKMKDIKKIKFNLKEEILYGFIGLLGVMWYVALMQHSYQHLFFTYRNVWVIITSLLLIIYNLFKKDSKLIEGKDIENNDNKSERNGL